MNRAKWVWAVVAASLTVLSAGALQADKSYQLQGRWIEGCECGIPCSCVMTGKAESGCQGVAAIEVRSGKYGDTNLAGAKAAVALQPGGWAVVYFDPATTQPQRDALTAILEPEVKGFGLHVEAVKTAPVTITGSDGRFMLSVPDVMSLQTEPVMGLDKTHPIQYRNLPDRFVRDANQGRSVSGSYKDAGHEFTLKDTNAFWYDFKVKG